MKRADISLKKVCTRRLQRKLKPIENSRNQANSASTTAGLVSGFGARMSATPETM